LEIKEGCGTLSNTEGEFVTFTAPEEPGITILHVTVTQENTVCSAESIITITVSLMERAGQDGKGSNKGIPGYTFVRPYQLCHWSPHVIHCSH